MYLMRRKYKLPDDPLDTGEHSIFGIRNQTNWKVYGGKTPYHIARNARSWNNVKTREAIDDAHLAEIRAANRIEEAEQKAYADRREARLHGMQEVFNAKPFRVYKLGEDAPFMSGNRNELYGTPEMAEMLEDFRPGFTGPHKAVLSAIMPTSDRKKGAGPLVTVSDKFVALDVPELIRISDKRDKRHLARVHDIRTKRFSREDMMDPDNPYTLEHFLHPASVPKVPRISATSDQLAIEGVPKDFRAFERIVKPKKSEPTLEPMSAQVANVLETLFSPSPVIESQSEAVHVPSDIAKDVMGGPSSEPTVLLSLSDIESMTPKRAMAEYEKLRAEVKPIYAMKNKIENESGADDPQWKALNEKVKFLETSINNLTTTYPLLARKARNDYIKTIAEKEGSRGETEETKIMRAELALFKSFVPKKEGKRKSNKS